MAAQIRTFYAAKSEDRTIIYDGEIHPYHVLLSKIDIIKSDFVWYLRDSMYNGLIYVDFMTNERVIADGRLTITWSYYSIAFGHFKKGWELANPNDPKEIKKLVQIDKENVVKQVHDLLNKLEQFQIAELNTKPEIMQLMQLSRDSKQQNATTLTTAKEDMRFSSEFRLDPTERQASRMSGLYQACSTMNLDQETLRKAIKKKMLRKNFLLRLLGFD